MPKLLYVEADDEIADVVSAVKATPDHDIAMVFPARARSLQTPLNVRLLAQYANGQSKRISVISEDTRIQQMARNASFATYASVPAFERGIEATRPHEGGMSAATMATAAGGSGIALALAEPKTAEELSSAWTAAAVKQAGPPTITNKRPTDRRPLYFAAIALAVIGLLLFLFVAPTATVTVTVAATPLSVSPVIQGSTNSTSATQANHVTTQVLTENTSNTFPANPSGSKQLPSTASAGTLDITTVISPGIKVMLTPDNTSFVTGGQSSVTFVPTQDTYLCIGPDGQAPPASSCVDPQTGNAEQPNADVPVRATTGGAATNLVSSTSLTWLQGNPCNQPSSPCFSSSDIGVSAPSGTSGGADPKTVTIASATDVSGWTTQVTHTDQSLQAKLTTLLNSQIGAGDAVARDPSGNGTSDSCSQPNPPLPAAGAQFSNSTITISCEGQYAVYKPGDVHNDLAQDLGASGQLPQGDQLLANSCKYSSPQVTQASTSGIVIISASASCWAIPTVNLSSLANQITGESTSDAARTLEQHVAGVQKVVSAIHPVGLLLPFFASRISVVIVPQKTSPPSS